MDIKYAWTGTLIILACVFKIPENFTKCNMDLNCLGRSRKVIIFVCFSTNLNWQTSFWGGLAITLNWLEL